MSALDLVSPYLPGLKRTKEDQISARCPFHKGGNERRPSFFMNIQNGLFYCHSCHASGNLAKFLLKMKVSPKTVERLTKDFKTAGAKIGYKRETTDERSFLPESVLAGYRSCPVSLLDAGFDIKLLRELDVGFDNQHSRITYPLRNEEGQLIGISGRAVVPGAQPKYLVYTGRELPGFPAYVPPKKDHLWNLHRVMASHMSGQEDTLYIVEGFKVCMWMIQYGYRNTVALIGADLARGQRKWLESLRGRFVLALDNDMAGLSGMNKFGRVLMQFGRVDVVDPDVLDRLEVHQLDSLDPDLLHEVLAKTINFVQFAKKMQQREAVHG